MAKAKKAEGKPALVKTEHRGRGHGLTQPEKWAIYQSFLALGTKAAAARALGVSPITVSSVCREIEQNADPKQLQETRELVAAQLTGRLHETTNQIIDSIKPDDLETGRIKQFDDQGNLISVKEYGPSLLQKVTAAAIMTDKMKVLSDFSRSIGADQQSGNLLIPESYDQLVEAIKHRVKSLQVLNVQFREDNPDLATRLDRVVEVTEAEVVEPDAGARLDFDNPA